MRNTQSALSYYGSDSEVAATLAASLDHCAHVSIPFVGGASILPHLQAKAIVCNDLNAHAIMFYKVCAGMYGVAKQHQLFYMAAHTLSHPHELRLAAEALQNPHADCVELAWAYWAACWIGRKGAGGTKAVKVAKAASVRRRADGGNNATRIRAAADGLRAWASEFERCEFTCQDWRTALQSVADHTDCGLYIDPPWIGAGDLYEHSFDNRDHHELAAAVRRFEHTTVVVRYGDNPQVRAMYSGMHIVDAATRTQANKTIGEIWITNKESAKQILQK